jgi:hypothetical protein
MRVKEYLDDVTGEKKELHMDDKLAAFLDKKVKQSLSFKDKDYVMLIDGYEGSGKSTLGQQIGRFVDPNLNLSRICMTADEFKDAINNSPKDSCVIYDEAVTGMSAGDSISKVGKVLKALMMQMRQKNLFVIIIIPSVFELNKYSVLSRARSFFHVYENKGMRGFYVGYNQKDLKNLYLKGKQFHTYNVRSYFNGRFWGKYAVNEEAYRKKKEEALKGSENKKSTQEIKDSDFIYLLLKRLSGYESTRATSEALSLDGFQISRQALDDRMARGRRNIG